MKTKTPKPKAWHYGMVGAILGLYVAILPMAVFWAIQTLVGYAIPYKPETIVAFWALALALKSRASIKWDSNR